MRRQLFRQASLERLSTPEKLDVLMTIARPRHWIAIGSFIVLVLVLAVWSVTAAIPVRMQATGALVLQGQLVAVTAVVDGQLTDIQVREGDRIARGEVVARLYNTTWSDGIAAAKNDVGNGAGSKAQSQGLASLPSVDVGAVSTADPLTGEAGAEGWEEADHGTEGLGVELPVADSPRTGGLDTVLAQHQEQLLAKSQLVSLSSGTVRRVHAAPGEWLHAGDTLLTVESGEESSRPYAVVYVPQQQARALQPGMEARVWPGGDRTSGSGAIIGAVEAVGTVPVDVEAVSRYVQSREMAAKLAGEGLMVEVRVLLQRDSAQPSGLAFTSPRSADQLVLESGMPCTVEFLTGWVRPIQWIM